MFVTQTRTWVCTTDKGSAALTLPQELTGADIADLEEWLQLILRSIKRQQIAPKRCPDGWHRTDDTGPHRRCITCGYEWEFPEATVAKDSAATDARPVSER
jgi:hypothetical protein